ncbi:MAG: heavy-metal-associated domain-containing protein [Candidatus Aquicultorales bacterium]
MSDRTVLKVSGMSCGHCVASVEKAAGGVPGVAKVAVDLGGGKVEIDHDGADLGAVKEAIEKAGYKVED